MVFSLSTAAETQNWARRTITFADDETKRVDETECSLHAHVAWVDVIVSNTKVAFSCLVASKASLL